MIIVFGSLNMDMIMPVNHFPEPGETILSGDYITRAGGKGSNQAMAAGRVDAKTAIVGKIGDDSFGRRSIKNLKHQSILSSGVGIADRPTGCAMIMVNKEGENTVAVASGANLETTADQVPDEILTERNTLLTQMEITPEETWKVIHRAYQNNCRTILNASPVGNIPNEVLSDLDFLIINEKESEQLIEKLGMEAETIEASARKIADLGDLTAIITLGRKGLIAISRNEGWRLPALDVDPVDTTGAGDCFCGVFAACLDRGDNIPNALHRASIAGGLSCLELGAQTGMPFNDNIDEYLESFPLPEKIF